MAGIFTYMTGNWGWNNAIHYWEMDCKTGKFLHVTGSGREGLNSPAQGGRAMAGIFTYVTGNWELLGYGQKDRKISPRGRKWERKAEFPW